MPPKRRLVWVIAVGALAGAVVGLLLAAAVGGGYRARATVMVAPALRKTGAELATTTATAAALAHSATVLDNVTRALQLAHGSLDRKVRADPRAGTALIDLAVEQPTAVRAERAAQQLLVVFGAVAGGRFPNAGGQAIVVVDSPGGTARPLGRPYAWFAVLSALLVGLLAGAAVVVSADVRRRIPARKPAVRTTRAAQPGPDKRPPPAPAQQRPEASEPAPVAEASRVIQPERAAEPERLPDRPPSPAPAAAGRVHIDKLERIAAAETDPIRAEEQWLYVEQLRGFATADGTLPAQFEPIVDEVFGWIAPGASSSGS